MLFEKPLAFVISLAVALAVARVIHRVYTRGSGQVRGWLAASVVGVLVWAIVTAFMAQ